MKEKTQLDRMVEHWAYSTMEAQHMSVKDREEFIQQNSKLFEDHNLVISSKREGVAWEADWNNVFYAEPDLVRLRGITMSVYGVKNLVDSEINVNEYEMEPA